MSISITAHRNHAPGDTNAGVEISRDDSKYDILPASADATIKLPVAIPHALPDAALLAVAADRLMMPPLTGPRAEAASLVNQALQKVKQAMAEAFSQPIAVVGRLTLSEKHLLVGTTSVSLPLTWSRISDLFTATGRLGSPLTAEEWEFLSTKCGMSAPAVTELRQALQQSGRLSA